MWWFLIRPYNKQFDLWRGVFILYTFIYCFLHYINLFARHGLSKLLLPSNNLAVNRLMMETSNFHMMIKHFSNLCRFQTFCNQYSLTEGKVITQIKNWLLKNRRMGFKSIYKKYTTVANPITVLAFKFEIHRVNYIIIILIRNSLQNYYNNKIRLLYSLSLPTPQIWHYASFFCSWNSQRMPLYILMT